MTLPNKAAWRAECVALAERFEQRAAELTAYEQFLPFARTYASMARDMREALAADETKESTL